MAVSPGETALAVMNPRYSSDSAPENAGAAGYPGRLAGHSPDPRLHILDLAGSGPAPSLDLPVHPWASQMRWLDERRLMFVGSPVASYAPRFAQIFDRSLNEVGRFLWKPIFWTLLANRVYGLAGDGSRLYMARPPSGRSRFVRGLLGHSSPPLLVALPVPVRYRPRARPACLSST